MFRLLSILMRTLLTAAGGAAMLLALSFPDSIIPPDPAMDYPHELSLYDFRDYLWVAPWLLMELASLMGPRRNLVWFWGLGLVLAAGIILWPVAEASAPELVHPTFDYEDGKLASGMGWMALLLLISLFTRCVLLRFLFAEPPLEREDYDKGHVDAAVLDPANARTVAEIAANPTRVNPHFLFGDADPGLIARFCNILRHLRLVRLFKYALFAALAALLAAWFFLYPQPTPQQELERDLVKMYEHTTVNGQMRATVPAVHAAYRVMRHISDHESFAGFTRQQAEEWLHLDRVPEGYRKKIRDESDFRLPFSRDEFESRTRFLTISTGPHTGEGQLASGRTAVLYIRTNETGDVINISEVQENGWNKQADLSRWSFSTDLNSQFLRN